MYKYLGGLFTGRAYGLFSGRAFAGLLRVRTGLGSFGPAGLHGPRAKWWPLLSGGKNEQTERKKGNGDGVNQPDSRLRQNPEFGFASALRFLLLCGTTR